MTAVLRLEYACSPAEMEQARTLVLRRQLGGGSKWRTRAVLLLMLMGMLLAAWFRGQEISPAYRVLLLAALVGGCLLFAHLRQRLRKAAERPIQVEVSEKDITILGSASRVALPWSAFSELLDSPDLFVLRDRPGQAFVVLPKRAFPDPGSQTWFHDHVTQALALAASMPSEPSAPTPFPDADRIALTIHLGYWDYVGRALVSWFTWVLCLGFVGMAVGPFLYAVANPPPDVAVGPTAIFVAVVLPMLLLGIPALILFIAAYSWRSAAKSLVPQQVTLAEQVVTVRDRDSNAEVPWTRFQYYLETRWSFILWRGSLWIMLPKRSFTSWDDVSRCRDLLQRHLKRSHWLTTA